MFTAIKQEDLSEIKEINVSQQIKTIVAAKYADWNTLVIQNLEFISKESQSIVSTEIPKDHRYQLDDPIEQ